MTEKLSAGDRVICNGDVDGKYFEGETGTIICDMGEYYRVNFDEDIRGWADTSNGVKYGHGWGVPPENLTRLCDPVDLENLSISIDDVLREI